MAHDEVAQLDLCDVEAHVRRILVSRRMANASGQGGEDVENIRAAYLQRCESPDGMQEDERG